MDGAKMSKSKGNVVRPADYIARFGLDAVRYFVFREMVFGQDANFADEALLTRYNADLANDLGNLVSRVTTLIHRSCGGVVPTPDASLQSRPPERAAAGAETLVASVTGDSGVPAERGAARHLGLYRGGQPLYCAARTVEARKTSRRSRVETLYTSAEALRIIAELLRPFMPNAAGRTLGMLGVTIRKDHGPGCAGVSCRRHDASETQPLFPGSNRQ